jgi:transcriptional regulatory protein RtcR
MATLCSGGRITVDDVEEEIVRLRRAWTGPAAEAILKGLLPAERIAELDLFDRLQLESVLAVCRMSQSLSDAGRRLFAVSRLAKAQSNDADRLRKFLGRFGLAWGEVTARMRE